MSRLFWLSMLAISLAAGSLTAAPKDEEEIRKVIDGRETAWSRHDAKAVPNSMLRRRGM